MTIRKPLVIEFTGTPNSGKTTLLKIMPEVLLSMGISVKVMQEDAEIVPRTIPKKTWIRNVWITLGQLQSLLESSYSDSDVIFLDRGFFDALFWADFLLYQGICSKEEADSLKRILDEMDKSFHLKPDVVFVFDVSTQESLKRRAAQSVEPVTMSTDTFLDMYRAQINGFIDEISVPIRFFDTTNFSIIEMQEVVLKEIFAILGSQ